MPLPINDLVRHTSALRAEVSEALQRVLSSGWYILGKEGACFEQEFAAYCGVRQCVGVANGTDALELSFRALGIGAGARVAIVSNAGPYAATALEAVGAVPIYVDVDFESQLMDLTLLDPLLARRDVDAVVVTHLFGLMHDMDQLRGIALASKVPLIEDCAQAHGARRNGHAAGSVGDVGCFSFYPTKNLGGMGDGGAIVTNDAALAERLRSLRQYGWSTKYQITTPCGRNSRLDEMQAAILRAMLPYLDRWNSRRREIARHYSEGIKHEGVVCPKVRGEEYVAHLYVVSCADRNRLKNHLAASGITSDVHYPIPDHQQFFRSEGHSLPTTERLSQRILTLPCFPEMTDDEVFNVIAVINAW